MITLRCCPACGAIRSFKDEDESSVEIETPASKPLPWLRADEVTEPGWYWFLGYCRFVTKVAVGEDGRLFANDPDLFFELISEIGDATARWQRIPEPELPKEET